MSVSPGAVFVAGKRMRRIVATHGGEVIYSKGGDRNFKCKVRSFRTWLARVRAVPFEEAPKPRKRWDGYDWRSAE